MLYFVNSVLIKENYIAEGIFHEVYIYYISQTHLT